MSQISPPIRILLIAAVVILAAWFTVVKPKPVTAEPQTTTPTAQTAYGKAVEKAKSVAATATPEAATSAAPTPTPAAALPPIAIPDETLAKLPKRVADALRARKVLVLGVFADGARPWRPQADDDRYVAKALHRANRYHGDVVVKAVAISELSTYAPLVNSLNVKQSPSVVVIDRELKGRVLTGYVDRISINQVIADARDATTSPSIGDPYLRDLNAFCGNYKLRLSRWSLPTIRGRKPALASLDRVLDIGTTYQRKLSKTDAPAKWRPLEAQFLKAVTSDLIAARAMERAIKNNDFTGARKVYAKFDRDAGVRLDRRFNDVGLTNCAGNRTA